MGRTSDTREQLINSAIELMYQRGYTAVSVKEVCEHADVNKGSFYYFFPSKRDLILAVLDRQWLMTRHHLLDPAFVSDLPVSERFHRFFQRVVASQKDTCTPVKGCFFGNMALELSTQDEIVRLKLQNIFLQWAEYFEQVLRKAVEAGELPEIDPRPTALTLLAFFEGAALLAKTHNDLSVVEGLMPCVKQLIVSPTEQH